MGRPPANSANHETDVAGLPVISALDNSQFKDAYLWPRRPALVSEAARDWRALGTWTPEFFSRNFGDRNVMTRRGTKRYRTSLRDYMRYVVECSRLQQDNEEIEPLYLRNLSVAEHFPELLDDFDVPQPFLPNWLEQWPLQPFLSVAPKSSAELFIGPVGASVARIHRDRYMTHSWLTQVYGEKQFWMIPPEDSALMYQDPQNQDLSLVNSASNPDLKKYPLFARTSLTTAVLRPGETIFIPAGWWHTAKCLTSSISISGNFVNGSNFADFRRAAASSSYSLFRDRSRSIRRFKCCLLGLNGAIVKLRQI
jgi:hypothetical protein